MKKSRLLRLLCYILIPLFVFILAFSTYYMNIRTSLSGTVNYYDDSFYKSDDFLYIYMEELKDASHNLIYNNKSEQYSRVEDGDMEIIYQMSNASYYKIEQYYYLIIYKNLAFTNVELTEQTKTIDEIKLFISENDFEHTTIINGNVNSSSGLIQNKAIQHFTGFNYTYYKTVNKEIDEELVGQANTEEIPETTKQYFETSIKDFEIYTMHVNKVKIEDFKDEEEFLEKYYKFENLMYVGIPLSAIGILISILYLIISIGHESGKDEIILNDFDKIYIEIILGVCGAIFVYFSNMLNDLSWYKPQGMVAEYTLLIEITIYIILYTLGAIIFNTFLKRIKAKTIFKSSLIAILLVWLLKKGIVVFKFLKKKITLMFEARTVAQKIIIVTLIYSLIALASILLFGPIGVGVTLAILIYFFIMMLEQATSYARIEKQLKLIYEGNHNDKLDPDDFNKMFKNSIEYLNDISSGFENAISEGVKSERLKTELITNVSHDIKTPLTSIINYVDLLSKENIDNEKVKEYIDVLDNKAHRLKKLTEDLVEASKASSGSVKLNIEKINIKELIKQTTGEFEDKFNDKKLEIIYDIPNEDVYINADSRYMYRIIENLFSNIYKYALEDSRVYIDIIKNNGIVKIAMKNISKERLNITSEELMQRFVRGDKSRTTEGSGLGLSISKSLTELQEGKFDLIIDGDLFKVDLEFKTI